MCALQRNFGLVTYATPKLSIRHTTSHLCVVHKARTASYVQNGPPTARRDATDRMPDPTAEALNRRELGLGALTTIFTAGHILPPFAYALGFKKELKKRRGIDPSLYTPLENGLQIYDIEEGKGPAVEKGTRLEVHYDCKYRGLDVVSSRAARLLGGNRVVAEPLDFVAGETISLTTPRVDDRGGGGLFSGASGPIPPPALSTAVYGMKKGGKRSILVPPDLGYGSKGMQEIPPDTPFELLVEILQILGR